MKKALSLLISFVILICSNCVYASEFKIIVDSEIATPGQIVNINLTLRNNPGIVSALFELKYDKKRLELIKAEDKALIGGAVFSQTCETYPYTMLWNSASPNNFTSDGVLATLTFKVYDNAEGGNAFINVSCEQGNIFDVDLNDVDIHINNGLITVLSEKSPGTENNTEDKTQGTETDTNENPPDGGEFDEEASEPENENTASPEISESKRENKNSGSAKTEITPEKSGISFNDVNIGDWHYDAVNFVVKNKLMSGISDTSFAPNSPITRGMLVTVLYRNEGCPKVTSDETFSDLKNDVYYADAVKWAKINGIVNGITESEFAPDQNITRQQIATILHRYAKYKNYNVSVGEEANLLSYEDYSDVSEYAIASMQYAVKTGLMKGKTESTLNPLDNSTRAEMAAMLLRFIEKM